MTEAKEARKEKLKLMGKAARSANLHYLTQSPEEENRARQLVALGQELSDCRQFHMENNGNLIRLEQI